MPNTFGQPGFLAFLMTLLPQRALLSSDTNTHIILFYLDVKYLVYKYVLNESFIWITVSAQCYTLYTLYRIHQIWDHGPQPDKGWIPSPGQRGVTAPSRGVQVSKDVLHGWRKRIERLIWAASAVMQTLSLSVFYQAICCSPFNLVPTFTFGYQLWEMTKVTGKKVSGLPSRRWPRPG